MAGTKTAAELSSQPTPAGAPGGTAAAAAAAGAAGAGEKLLTEALSLAASYGAAAEWEVLVRYTAGLLIGSAAAAAAPLRPELRQELTARAKQALDSAASSAAAAAASGAAGAGEDLDSNLNSNSNAGGVIAAAALALVVGADAWPQLPPSSASHVAAALAVLTDAVEALSLSPSYCPAPMAAAAAALLPCLGKLRDLLDKAGGVLRGLAIRRVLTPLLAPLLQQLQLQLLLASCSSSSSSDAAGGSPGAEAAGNLLLDLVGAASASAPTRGALLSAAAGEAAAEGEIGPGSGAAPVALIQEAQGAVYAYVTPANVAAAAKLLKALQVRGQQARMGGQMLCLRVVEML